MKYIHIFISLFFFSVTTSAQERLVLIEEFTNTGCNPCASWSPVLDEVISQRLGECIAIKYHSGYPDDDDIYYNYDKQTQQKRLDFYDVDGVPTTYVNGVEIHGRTEEALHTAITDFKQQPLYYNLQVSKTLSNHHLAVQANLTPIINKDNASQVRLFVGVIEEHITSAFPYPNGETELNYTLRKMLTGGEGYPLSTTTLSANETYTYNGTWDIDFMNDEGQLGVVAFLQDMETKEVLCTAYSGPNAEKENHVNLMRLIDTPDLTCMPNYFGQVIFLNDGANTLTSATLHVEVNGTVKQYTWEGALGYLQRDTMSFDSFTDFSLKEEDNQVRVWLSGINGSEVSSNTLTSTFQNSVQASHAVRLRLYTDKKPEETTWKVYNSAGDVVQQGGPYSEGRKIYNIDLGLASDDCYLLEFEDAGGDGIIGDYGNGYYQLFQVDADGKTTRLTQGDYDGSSHDVYFNLRNAPVEKRRLVVFEEFTNTSCDPCAEFSPALDKVIYGRMGDMVAITYHLNYPSSQDPFYLANPTEAMARANYYEVSGVPSLRVDGGHAGAWGYEDRLDSYIDEASTVDAQVDIDTRAELVDGLLKVDVSLTPLDIAENADLRLYVAVVEERVEWDEPAPNGEKSWNYVMRKLLPDAQGETLPADLPIAVPTERNYSWQVANYYDEKELGIVTFVQDNTTQKILGACYTPRPTGSERSIKLLKTENTPDRICLPRFSCDLVVRNTGRETLTSTMLNVRINGDQQSTPWTGQMNYLDIDTLSIPTFSDFALATDNTNEVEIWLSGLNGGTEESDHKKLQITNAHKAENGVRLTLMTDNAPEETTWKVYNSAEEVVCEGGPYSEARKKQVIDLPLTDDDCYRLEFEDAGGNGITGENGRGYYMLHEVNAEGNTRLLVQADFTGATHNVYFSLTNAAPSGIAPVAGDITTHQPWYDLQGRRVSEPHRGIYIKNKKKTINK